MFSNGLSSSAATTANYPSVVTSWDNVQAQNRLLQEEFGIEQIHAVYGFSIGAQQDYHWAAAFPDRVARAAVVCCSAWKSAYNKVFLSSLLLTLEAAPDHLGVAASRPNHGWRFAPLPTFIPAGRSARISIGRTCTSRRSMRPIWKLSCRLTGRTAMPINRLRIATPSW
jgi:pimeloyl-ACP methyl ester carboxylesterase